MLARGNMRLPLFSYFLQHETFSTKLDSVRSMFESWLVGHFDAIRPLVHFGTIS